VAPLITSAANPRLKLVRKLESGRQRRKLGLFVVEGEDLVEAGLAAGLEPVDLLRAAEDVEAGLLATVSGLPHPPRVVAVFRTADLPRAEPRTTSPLGLALWRVADPGNVGTLIRCADAFGAFIALSRGCADPTSPRALRGSAGAVFRVSLLDFEEAPGPRIGLVAHGGVPLAEAELPERATFVLGAERVGVPPDVLERCETAVSIPIAEAAESLNVAAAGAIALYEWSRRHVR
jgi:TrmH family RNA methyltransferase